MPAGVFRLEIWVRGLKSTVSHWKFLPGKILRVCGSRLELFFSDEIDLEFWGLGLYGFIGKYYAIF